ncbi:MAG: hypothetical protein ABW082_11590 [Sedimenticola sp.]
MNKKPSKVTSIKPATADRVEEARKNILRKLQILEYWLENKPPIRMGLDGYPARHPRTGEEQIDFVPTSVKSFLSWDGSQNCKNTIEWISKRFGVIRGTGQETLYRYDDLLELVKVRTGTLKSLVVATKKHRVKSNKIKKLEQEITRLTETKKNVQIQFRQYLDKIEELRSELNDEQSRHNSTKAIWCQDKERLEKENVDLRRKNHELTLALAKVTPMRDIKE